MNEKSDFLEISFDVKTKDTLIWRDQIVMSSTEHDYFFKLFRTLKENNILSTTVLEIGYGLGISATLIQNVLKPHSHTIVEIDKGVYADMLDFSRKHKSIKPILSDWRSYNFEQNKYDFIFHDSYDYTGEKGWKSTEGFDDYQAFRKLLNPGGCLCHPHFGNGPIRPVEGFNTTIIKRLGVSPILMWDKSICDEAAVVIRRPIA